MKKAVLFGAFAVFCAAVAPLFTGCSTGKIVDYGTKHKVLECNGTNAIVRDDLGFRIWFNDHWEDKNFDAMDLKAIPGNAGNFQRSYQLSFSKWNSSVNSNIVALVDKSAAGLAQDLTAATALVNSLEGGGVSTASSSLLNSLLANAKSMLAGGNTNGAAIALGDLQAAISALQKTSSTCTTCTTNADGTVTCTGGECSIPK